MKMSKMGLHYSFGHLKHKLWSIWQFNSQPLKVENRPDFLVCKWRATYHWKALNKGYNFDLYRISIRDLHTKFWGPKVVGVPILRISRLPFGNHGTKCHLDVGLVERHILYYKGGKLVASPKSRPWWVLWIRVCMWFVLAPKKFKLCINQLVWFVHVCVNNWCLSLFLVPIPELQHAPLPPKCCKPGSMPQLFALLLLSPYTHIWVYKGGWERVIFDKCQLEI
jgi:hypothetical protein